MMKTKFLYSAALVLALAGCSEDELAELNSGIASNETVRVSASIGADTRLAVSDAGSQLAFAWEDTDKITIYKGTQATNFVIDSECTGSSLATFSGTPSVPFHQGETLFGVFNRRQNAANNGLDENGNLVIDLGDQTGELNDEYQYMFAQSTFDGNTTFNFKHLVSILKVNVTLPEGVSNLDKLTLLSNNYMVDKATVVMNTPIQGPWQYYSAGQLVADFTNGEERPIMNSISVDHFEINGNIATAYIYVLPAMLYSNGYEMNGSSYDKWHWSAWMTPYFIVETNGNNYISSTSFGERDLQPGKMYELNTELKDIPTLVLGENEGVGSYQEVVFTPETDGFYRVSGANYDIMNNNVPQVGGYYYELTAGSKYRFYIYEVYNDIVTVEQSSVTSLDLGETFSGDPWTNNLYSFTPSEDGYYQMWGDGYGYFNAGNSYNYASYLLAGKTYYGYFYFNNNYNNEATLVKASEMTVNEGQTLLPDPLTVLTFTPQVSDYYRVQTNTADAYWLNLGYGAQFVEAGKTYTMIVNSNYSSNSNGTVINLSTTKVVENMEVNVAYSPEEYGSMTYKPEISFNGDRSTTWYYVDFYNCNVYRSGSSSMYYDVSYNGVRHITRVNEYSRYTYYDIRSYGEKSYVVLRRYEEETADLSLDEEYTVEPGHVIAYQFTAPEDGEYSISHSQGEWSYWYEYGNTTRYFSAGDTDVIYVCVPEKYYDNTTVFTVSKVEE